MKAILAALAVCLCTPAWADCFNRDHLASWLRIEHDMRLVAWGLNADGYQEELFVAPSGMWAVVLWRPDKCAELRSFPVDFQERLVDPPKRNWALPTPRRLDRGEPL